MTAPVVESVEQCVVGQLVERAVVTGDGDAPARQVDVVEVHRADLAGARRVDRGQYEGEPGRRGCRGCNGLVQLVGTQGLPDRVIDAWPSDPGGRITKDQVAVLGPAEKRPQGVVAVWRGLPCSLSRYVLTSRRVTSRRCSRCHAQSVSTGTVAAT